jgi:phosphohistidine phosphatase
VPSLCFLRHADAAPAGSELVKDADRPLTELGRAQMVRAAVGMRRLGLTFDAVLTSPYLRARQTAEIVAGTLECLDRTFVEDALASGARWPGVRAALGPHAGAASVLLVGHQPDLSEMTAAILEASGRSIAYGKGTLACVTVGEIPPVAPGSLSFLLRGEFLAALAG